MEPNEPSLLEQFQGRVQEIRESPGAQKLDNFIEGLDNFLGASGKAWLANGLDELRQAVSLGTEQVQDANSPGIWGTITTGEATAERMEGKTSLDDLRAHAEGAQEANNEMDRGMDDGRGR